MRNWARRGSIALIIVAAVGSADCAGRFNDTVWHPLAAWALATQVGTYIANSSWLFAVIESCHLLGLALLGGSVLIVDFRLLGLVFHDESVQQLARDAETWLFAGLGLMLFSGLLLFLSEATKFYSEGFWDSAEAPFIYKMLFLALAISFTFTLRRWVLSSDGSDAVGGSRWRDRLVAVASMFLWFAVGACGRAIGFY